MKRTSPSVCSTSAVELAAHPVLSSPNPGVSRTESTSLPVKCRPTRNTSATSIWFLVSVPVLSVQITVALPMVSAATILRTRLLSSRILRIPSPNAMKTAIGRPSGTATTMIVTATMKNRSTSLTAS
jgi:hypothetical protein